MLPSVEQLYAKLNREQTLQFFRDAIGRESITGNEANIVELLEQHMLTLSLDSVARADFLPGRPNVWGERKGQGGGPRLLFIGHTDVVHVDGWREHWSGDVREDPFGAPIIDGEVWGRGSGDLKAGICASLSALSLLDALGVKLKGDVAFAFVGDEESGQCGSGVSAGIKHYAGLMRDGSVPVPDFTVYTEPTQLSVYAAQMGFFIADITVTGKSVYFGVPEQGHDALKATHKLLGRLFKHSDEISARAEHDLVGRAFLLVTGINGGGYIAVPGECSVSLIRKLLPGESLDTAVAEMQAVIDLAAKEIDDSQITIEISYPAGRDHPLGGSASEINKNMHEVTLLSQSVGSAMAGRGEVAGAPYWSEAPFFINEFGKPAAYCAPGDIRNCHTYNERVNIEEYYAGIVGFALFIANYCGVAE